MVKGAPMKTEKSEVISNIMMKQSILDLSLLFLDILKPLTFGEMVWISRGEKNFSLWNILQLLYSYILFVKTIFSPPKF